MHEHAGVVDQHIQSSVSAQELVGRRLTAFGIGDIHLYEINFQTFRSQAGLPFKGLWFAVCISERRHDLVALTGEHPANRFSDSSGSAGNQGCS
jgi:hypothetical protein